MFLESLCVISKLTFFIPSKANIVYKKYLFVIEEGMVNFVSAGQRRFLWWGDIGVGLKYRQGAKRHLG